MKDSGVAIMGEGIGSGDNRASMQSDWFTCCSRRVLKPTCIVERTSGSKEVTLDEIQLILIKFRMKQERYVI